ncbi:MAG: hypothetical protein KAI47_13485 [Deltaproteobacteria bacterium]|nr:hypothetical protein [Deltaproteobacteria bacterium]
MSSESSPSSQPKRRKPKKPKRGVHWRWVWLGVALMVSGHVVAYYLLAHRIQALVVHDPFTAFTSAGGASLAIFWLGGLFVGRLSPGTTIQEPAVAGVLGLLIIVGLQLFAGMINIFGLILGAPFTFGMAYLGGWMGEVWQRFSERRRARHQTMG